LEHEEGDHVSAVNFDGERSRCRVEESLWDWYHDFLVCIRGTEFERRQLRIP